MAFIINCDVVSSRASPTPDVGRLSSQSFMNSTTGPASTYALTFVAASTDNPAPNEAPERVTYNALNVLRKPAVSRLAVMTTVAENPGIVVLMKLTIPLPPALGAPSAQTAILFVSTT